MRRLAKISICLFLLGIPWLNFTTAARAVMEDTILAIVNDDVITYRDLRDYLRSRTLQLKLDGVPESEIKARAAELESNGIQRLIQDKLIINEANRQGLQVQKPAVDERIDNIKKSYPSEQAFIAALEQEGVSVSDLRKKIEDQIKVQHIIDTEIKKKIYVNPQEVTDYYNAHLASFKKPERVSLDSIFIPKTADATAQTRANEALKLIQSGEDFRKVAEKYSATPALGAFEKGKLMPQLESAAWSLAVDQTSPVIATDSGFYILKVLGKTPAQTASLEEVKDQIQSVVFNQKFVQKLGEWLEQLEKTNFIEIRNPEGK